MTRLNSTRALFTMGLRAGAALAALAAAPAFAQDARVADQAQASQATLDQGDDVIVVARKRSERLLDVPIAVTALSADALSKAQATDLSGVQGDTAIGWYERTVRVPTEWSGKRVFLVIGASEIGRASCRERV